MLKDVGVAFVFTVSLYGSIKNLEYLRARKVLLMLHLSRNDVCFELRNCTAVFFCCNFFGVGMHRILH